MRSVRIIGDQLITYLLVAVNLGYVRTGDDGDLRLRKTSADGPERGHCHYGIAHPIGRTDQDFHAAAPLRAWTLVLIRVNISSSSGSSNPMRVTYRGIASNLIAPRFRASFSLVTKAFAPESVASLFKWATS